MISRIGRVMIPGRTSSNLIEGVSVYESCYSSAGQKRTSKIWTNDRCDRSGSVWNLVSLPAGSILADLALDRLCGALSLGIGCAKDAETPVPGMDAGRYLAQQGHYTSHSYSGFFQYNSPRFVVDAVISIGSDAPQL